MIRGWDTFWLWPGLVVACGLDLRSSYAINLISFLPLIAGKITKQDTAKDCWEAEKRSHEEVKNKPTMDN